MRVERAGGRHALQHVVLQHHWAGQPSAEGLSSSERRMTTMIRRKHVLPDGTFRAIERTGTPRSGSIFSITPPSPASTSRSLGPSARAVQRTKPGSGLRAGADSPMRSGTGSDRKTVIEADGRPCSFVLLDADPVPVEDAAGLGLCVDDGPGGGKRITALRRSSVISSTSKAVRALAPIRPLTTVFATLPTRVPAHPRPLGTRRPARRCKPAGRRRECVTPRVIESS